MSERDFIFWLRGFLETKQSETIDTIKEKLETAEQSQPSLLPQYPRPGVIPVWPGPSEFIIPPTYPGELPYRVTCQDGPESGGSGGAFTTPGIIP